MSKYFNEHSVISQHDELFGLIWECSREEGEGEGVELHVKKTFIEEVTLGLDLQSESLLAKHLRQGLRGTGTGWDLPHQLDYEQTRTELHINNRAPLIKVANERANTAAPPGHPKHQQEWMPSVGSIGKTARRAFGQWAVHEFRIWTTLLHFSLSTRTSEW